MRLLAIATLLVSSAAFACPNLTGEYAVCRNAADNTHISTSMVVNQSVQNRITTYQVSVINAESGERESETYRADGKVHTEVVTDDETGMTLETSSSISCTGTASLNINMDVKLNGEAAGYMKIKVSKAGKQLIVDSTNFDGEETTTMKEICE